MDIADVAVAFVDAWGPPLPRRERDPIAGMMYEVGRWRRGPVDVRVDWMLVDGTRTHVSVQFEEVEDYADRIRPWRP